jgi:phosphopentomutase
MDAIERLWPATHDGLIVAVLPDFDALHGHGRDLHGFAAALHELDAWLQEFLPKTEAEDLVLITADHGNDPTFPGTGHTREEVPLIAIHGKKALPLGNRETFADVASTLAACFELHEKWPGNAFLGGQSSFRRG